MLAALAERTGVSLARLRAMALAGWQPWLFDAFPMSKHDAQETFDTYVRANPVLLAPGEAGIRDVSRWNPWSGRGCPATGSCGRVPPAPPTRTGAWPCCGGCR
jgi:hypothetical protein